MRHVVVLLLPWISFGGTLSTFRIDKLRINNPLDCECVFEEAYKIVQKYFLGKDKYDDSDWQRMKEEYSGYGDKHLAIKSFLNQFKDPYTSFIPRELMLERSQSYRGERASSGLEVCKVYRPKVQKILKWQTESSATSLGEVLRVQAKKAQVAFEVLGPLAFVASNAQRRTSLYWKGGACFLSAVGILRFALPKLREVRISDVAGPASRTLSKGDEILSIGGKSIAGLSMSQIRSMLDVGPVGEEIQIGFRRKGDLPRTSSFDMKSEEAVRVGTEVTITRGFIPLENIQRNVLQDNIAYLGIGEFTERTLDEVQESLIELEKVMHSSESESGPGRKPSRFSKKTKAIVLDLRGNRGGTLEAALDVASLFLPSGTVLFQMAIPGKSKMQKHWSTNKRADISTPILVLTDRRTGSASEVLTAALQDNHRATTVGRVTTGKDIAQAVLTLTDGSGIALTVRSYKTPSGASMNEGVRPDYDTEYTDLHLSHLRWVETDQGTDGYWLLRKPDVTVNSPRFQRKTCVH
jgi:C-terminal processing protease CtpA/Prc